MPTSDYHHISDVLHVVEQAQPQRVLDIGVGFGKWGLLCRDVLDVYHERLDREQWAVRIDGIEIHEAYRNPLWTFAYNEIHIGHALDVLPTLEHFDLILCNDVIEHLDKAAGHTLLTAMLERGDRVVITSPRGFSPQGATYGNDHQRHLSGWTEADFDGLPHLYKDVGFTFMAVLSSDPAMLEPLKFLDPLTVLGVRKGTAALARLAVQRAAVRMKGQ